MSSPGLFYFHCCHFLPFCLHRLPVIKLRHVINCLVPGQTHRGGSLGERKGLVTCWKKRRGAKTTLQCTARRLGHKGEKEREKKKMSPSNVCTHQCMFDMINLWIVTFVIIKSILLHCHSNKLYTILSFHYSAMRSKVGKRWFWFGAASAASEEQLAPPANTLSLFASTSSHCRPSFTFGS